jgi:hypothetical protein
VPIEEEEFLYYLSYLFDFHLKISGLPKLIWETSTELWELNIHKVNRMGCERTVSQLFNDKPRGCVLRGSSTNVWWNSVQTDINEVKFKIK